MCACCIAVSIWRHGFFHVGVKGKLFDSSVLLLVLVVAGFLIRFQPKRNVKISITILIRASHAVYWPDCAEPSFSNRQNDQWLDVQVTLKELIPRNLIVWRNILFRKRVLSYIHVTELHRANWYLTNRKTINFICNFDRLGSTARKPGFYGQLLDVEYFSRPYQGKWLRNYWFTVI